jgi:hypothetical protein
LQLFDAGSSFNSGMLSHQQRRRPSPLLYIAVGGAVFALATVIVVISVTSGSKGNKNVAAEPSPPPGPSGPVTPAPATADPNTGFDLYVNPGGMMTWRLDGDVRKDKLPSHIRGVAPGVHQVAIDAPPGFMSQSQAVTVEAGKAPRVDITLTPLAVTGAFETTPKGAKVSLIVNGEPQELGPSPAKAPLDPRKSYQVLFAMPGYVSVNRPVVFTGSPEEKIAVTLEKVGSDAPPAPPASSSPPASTQKVAVAPPTVHGPVSHPEGTSHDAPSRVDAPTHVDAPPHVDPPSHVETPKPAGKGTLALMSKPPCDIMIDGSSTGMHTPQPQLKLEAGKHKVTLVNKEFDINETFMVEIKPDDTVKELKDYSDKLPK